jgi:PhnB protein
MKKTSEKPATTASTPRTKNVSLTARLVVKDAVRAIAWYVEHLGARDILRYATKEGSIVHAEIEVAGALVYLVEESRGWHNHAPPSLGGTPVLLALEVDDVDGLAARMVAGGATVIFPIADQFYGERGGRLQDPFGHVWMVSKVIEHLSPEEMQRRMDAFEG